MSFSFLRSVLFFSALSASGAAFAAEESSFELNGMTLAFLIAAGIGFILLSSLMPLLHIRSRMQNAKKPSGNRKQKISESQNAEASEKERTDEPSFSSLQKTDDRPAELTAGDREALAAIRRETEKNTLAFRLQEEEKKAAEKSASESSAAIEKARNDWADLRAAANKATDDVFRKLEADKEQRSRS